MGNIKEIQVKVLEMKTTKTEMKNALYGINGIADTTEEKMINLKT